MRVGDIALFGGVRFEVKQHHLFRGGAGGDAGALGGVGLLGGRDDRGAVQGAGFRTRWANTARWGGGRLLRGLGGYILMA